MLDHPPLPTAVQLVYTQNDLEAIRKPNCGAAVWHRNTSGAFQSWLTSLADSHLPMCRIIVAPQAVEEALHAVFAEANTPSSTHKHRLITDIAQLADHFAALMSAKWLRLRLDVVTTNACRKFHVDAVTARLICTYRGTGTQLGIAENGNDPTDILTVPTGAVTVLRGTKWPTETHTALRHRSPPIEGTGETRLMLILDPLEAPMEEVCY